MSYFGWSGLALTHGSMGGTDGKHWTEDEKTMKEVTEKYKEMTPMQPNPVKEALEAIDSPNLWKPPTNKVEFGVCMGGEEYDAYKMCCYLYLAKHRETIKAALQAALTQPAIPEGINTRPTQSAADIEGLKATVFEWWLRCSEEFVCTEQMIGWVIDSLASRSLIHPEAKPMGGWQQALTAAVTEIDVERKKSGDAIDDNYLNNFHGGWNACLDHLLSKYPERFK